VRKLLPLLLSPFALFAQYAPVQGMMAQLINGKVVLTWNASPTAGVTYDIYRNAVQIANSVNALTYTDATVVAGQSYSYTARANMESVDSNTASVTIPPATTPPPVVVPTNSAVWVNFDTATKANWKGVYGSDGYAIALTSQVLPSYASLAITGDQTWTWAAGGALGTTCWYSPASWSIGINVGSAAHQVALYAIDYDHQGRSETFVVKDPSGNVLDTRSISNFAGEYLVWDISGSVTITITGTYPNSVVSGIFFDP